MRLVPPASIGGRVLIQGAAGEGACLTLVDEAKEVMHFTLGAHLLENGEFLFTGLPPGRYHFWMSCMEGARFDRPLAAWDLNVGEDLRNVIVNKNP